MLQTTLSALHGFAFGRRSPLNVLRIWWMYRRLYVKIGVRNVDVTGTVGAIIATLISPSQYAPRAIRDVLVSASEEYPGKLEDDIGNAVEAFLGRNLQAEELRLESPRMMTCAWCPEGERPFLLNTSIRRHNQGSPELKYGIQVTRESPLVQGCELMVRMAARAAGLSEVEIAKKVKWFIDGASLRTTKTVITPTEKALERAERKKRREEKPQLALARYR